MQIMKRQKYRYTHTQTSVTSPIWLTTQNVHVFQSEGSAPEDEPWFRPHRRAVGDVLGHANSTRQYAPCVPQQKNAVIKQSTCRQKHSPTTNQKTK